MSPWNETVVEYCERSVLACRSCHPYRDSHVPQVSGRASGRRGAVRNLRDLISGDPAWPLVQEWIAAASNRVEVLPASEPARSLALEATQVTTRSPMGAVIFETGGILIDGGWLRILGSGHPRLPRSLPDWNKGRTWTEEHRVPPILLVADDVVGGLFAVNGGGFDGPPGHVHYFAPDRLGWESLESGYSDFLQWTLQGDLEAFYEGQRWPGWLADPAVATPRRVSLRGQDLRMTGWWSLRHWSRRQECDDVHD